MGCKVDTLIERHSLTVPAPEYDSVNEYLVARWTGSDGRSADGYKALTEWFNKRLLKRLYEEHDRDTVTVHLDREYELITGDETLHRDELAADLATDGLDIDEIDSELPSWSTMRHHLKDCLEAEKDTQPADTDWETDTVRMAREQATEKAQSVLSSLASKGRLRNGEQADVDVQVKLSCPECSVRVPFADAVERGYVCETHFDAESDESVREKGRNALSLLAVPYGLLEGIQTAVLEDPYLVEAVATAAIPV
ncbi:MULTISPECIES: rod-determining factor RdfA [Natrinema]|uniref:Uncharacterized protein n=1 Tax=Natrinema gari JCM 14663 TaxID=1230459 RepID=L9YS63_9EURY|nr:MULTISPECIES: rod-determining factor RdfA [Natrinema]AFO58904.1 hypothetical protein NJ7G_3688 [Natrinema sp. J7-2]ELY77045.1 hypothetical protein C486_16380 [Natrinema gari JCM 14663]